MTSAPVALVAGASRGLGLVIARELLRRGHQVAICARTPADLARAEDLLRAEGPVRAFPCDVRDPDQVLALVRQVRDALGPVEVLVSVAGVIQVGPADSMTEEHYEQAIDTMLWGPIRLTRAVLPDMRERGHGRIGTVTSIGGKVAPPHLLPYAVAKFGAVGFSEGLAAELAGTGVSATTIVPGLMRTGSHERAHFTGDHDAEFAWFGPAASLPLLTMSVDRAARKIVEGVLDGRPLVTLTPLAKIGSRVHGIAPATTVRALGLASRLLPTMSTPSRSTVSPHAAVPGRQARAGLSRGARAAVDTLTLLGSRAARRTNQRGGAA
ncbi:SDR family NAD(P)-dependent oxidoreductase [Ornithinimicrobium murale]|uniref:SDR family NAD(P)-dependent oxidoreductase n=1 Tax=Ornithinimicrobium murale TaxID=1050153 RepID=UPI000E0DCE41|nr:SDR family NAD(P)-dependent oxidoreductase [Ornithinimicrobium murale]